MFKSLILLAVLGISSIAQADHSLKDVMTKPSIAKAVQAAVASKAVYCSLSKSLQLKPTTAAANDYDSWRQVAICFDTEANQKAFETTPFSSQFGGIYGLNGAKAILDVTYNQNSGKVFEISIR